MTRTALSPIALATLAALGIAAAASAQGQQNFDAVEIKTTKLADGLYELEGQGGNIVASVGQDGVLIVDDQFAPLSDKIRAALARLSDKPVSFVINTHHHGDHTGGNANFGAAGATIVAHENVRKHLAAPAAPPGGGAAPPVAPASLPVVTFAQDVTFHFNGETIRVTHVPPAHTDGDSLVIFEKANVIHTGDVFRTTSYPAADTAGGGSFTGILDDYAIIKELAKPDTKLVPGHGVVSTEAALDEQLAVIADIRAQVDKAKAAGKSLDEVKALKPSAKYDEKWADARWSGDYVVTALYEAAK